MIVVQPATDRQEATSYPWKSSAFQLLIGNSLLVRCGSRGKTLHLWTVLSSSSVNLASMRWSENLQESTELRDPNIGLSSIQFWEVWDFKSWKLSNLWIAESVDISAKKWWLADVDSLCGPSWATNRPTNDIWAIPKWCTERCSHKYLISWTRILDASHTLSWTGWRLRHVATGIGGFAENISQRSLQYREQPFHPPWQCKIFAGWEMSWSSCIPPLLNCQLQ